ncbi:MAG: L,D-transpeptidase family protein [Marinosulfonomonas sp.]|nr:L,D-transpeptidase family protein [Marinosulfonomonas sp.]
MLLSTNFRAKNYLAATLAFAFIAVSGAFLSPAHAQVTAFMQSVAEASARDKSIAKFYQANGYSPIWTGRSGRDRARRKALLDAFSKSGNHGLPQAAYDTELLKANLRQVKSERDLGRIEVELSKLFLAYAQDIQTGILVPSRIDSGIVRKVPLRNRTQLLTNFAKSSPAGFLNKLAPSSPEYTRLMKQKLTMERLLAKGGWGATVPGRKLEPGHSGNSVVALRNRLIKMGYLRRNASTKYDANLQKAVQQFQLAHGLNPDGVAGAGTLKEINVSPEKRLASIVVAMERERWTNMARGKRHIWVNLTDFSAQIIDNGKVTFQTRSVVGANTSDRRSPEFSDVMEHMVINPTWNVPRSIAVKEYLPLLQKNPNAAGHLNLIDQGGRVVSRAEMDFTQFTETDFPFDLKQPPSRRNALGLVKFMFPNRHNIYLHDTPAKKLFSRESRAFSHGCIRLRDPFDFAYALLAKQIRNPEQFFQSKLATGVENVVPLEKQVPVHLVYRTAFTSAKGNMNYRRDIYGRDARIFKALQKAGVALRAVQS